MRLHGGSPPFTIGKGVDLEDGGMTIRTLANILLRLSEGQTNQRQYLLDILSAKFSDINTQNGQIVATTVNGKSMTLQVSPGTGLADIAEAANLALSFLEKGINQVPGSAYAVVR